jgi:ATP-dependent Lon protease
MTDLQTALTLPVLPLTTGVVLPQMVVTIALETDEAKAATAAAGEGGRLLLVPRIDGANPRVGVIARIESSGTLPGGASALVVRAESRARLGVGVVGTTDTLWLQAEPVDEGEPTERARELARELRATLKQVLEHIGGRRLSEALRGLDDPSELADAAGWWPDLSLERKVELLETIDVEARVEKVLSWAKESLGELELAERIRTDVSEGMEQQQREFLLRRQMESIRKELGEDGEEDAVADYREKLAALDGVSDDVRQAVEREIGRLERTSPQAMEHGWIRTWLDTVFELPWNVRTEDHLDLGDARAVLDADHHGLEQVKDRIVEHLAVRKLRAERGVDTRAEHGTGAPDAATDGRGRALATVIALVGPPGVGKTSLGASIARALGRNFVRVALGGVRDEAEIRGHRRTYVGAQPGRIVRAMTEAGSRNPVFLLDEIDKVGADWRGDPSSALLEVLDPAQNHSFRDHYLEVDLDLSEVIFLATANTLDTIPPPLLDRMEIVRLDGYTEDEKVAIARDHLLPRQLERTGLRPGEVVIEDDALGKVVADYTREAGVRSLERELGKLLRKLAVDIGSAPTGAEPIDIGPERVGELLGKPRFFSEAAERPLVPGVATGLAVTGAGGDVLFVETTAMPETDGKESSLTVTGQLGDVMKESAQIALSYVRSRRDALGIAPGTDQRRFHVHFPAGAIPKDGPSAGVTMTTALVSLLTGRPVRREVAMTGEVTLQGRVLPIGGVKQKVLAAHRAGLTEVILPARNGIDLDDVPETVRQQMTFHLVDDVADVVRIALLDSTSSADPASPIQEAA